MDLRTIFAVGGGLFKSTDDGTTWTNLNPAPQVTTAVQAAAMDPSNPLVLYEAIPSQFCGFFCGVIPGAVLKSTDGGQTWAMKQVISQATVLVDPNSPATIYADNFRSADGGETWTQLPQRMRIVAIDSNSNLYGFPLSGPITQLEISADGGQTWAVFYDATASSPLATFAADPASPGTLYLGGAAQMDAFLVKLGPEGGLIDTKFLGGSGADHASAVAVDGSGNAYLAGSTDSGDFPAVGPVLPYAGPLTTFATRLDGGTYLPTFSSFLGAGAFFVQTGMAVDAEGNIIVVGSTMSPRLPVTNAIQPSLDGASDAFVIKVKPD